MSLYGWNQEVVEILARGKLAELIVQVSGSVKGLDGIYLLETTN